MKFDLIHLSKAINKLRPGCQYKLDDNDYENIEWFKLDGDAPTIEEIAEAIELVKLDEIEQEKQAKLKKEELLNRLGITEDEAKLLLN